MFLYPNNLNVNLATCTNLTYINIATLIILINLHHNSSQRMDLHMGMLVLFRKLGPNTKALLKFQKSEIFTTAAVDLTSLKLVREIRPIKLFQVLKMVQVLCDYFLHLFLPKQNANITCNIIGHPADNSYF